jgi:hypothetical protein
LPLLRSIISLYAATVLFRNDNSDTRLDPMLDCKYLLDFNRLPIFLRNLMGNNYASIVGKLSQDVLKVILVYF